MEQTVKDIEEQNKGEMELLLTKHKVALKPFNDAVDAQRAALVAAQATGNSQAIESAQLGLNTALRDQERERDQQKKEQEELKKGHDSLVKIQKEEVDVRQKQIDTIKRAPQEGYARGLETMPWGILYRNSHAAENIRKNVGKSKEEKDVDTLMDLLKKNSASPASGGASAAPSASGGH